MKKLLQILLAITLSIIAIYIFLYDLALWKNAKQEINEQEDKKTITKLTQKLINKEKENRILQKNFNKFRVDTDKELMRLGKWEKVIHDTFESLNN